MEGSSSANRKDRRKTSIPVPEVHSYNLNLMNDIGAPYMLIDYIDGTIAAYLREAKGCPLGIYGSAELDRKFRKQMAAI